MEGRQRLYYALGQLIYCVALADKEIQQEEVDKVHEVISELSSTKEFDYNIAEIVLLMQSKHPISTKMAYRWALEEINLCKHYFNESLRDNFIEILKDVALAFNGVEQDEESLLNHIIDDIQLALARPSYSNT